MLSARPSTGHSFVIGAIALLSALPSTAVAAPCRAFAFFTEAGDGWRPLFQATMTHYQARAEQTAGTREGDRYARLLDRLFDCYSRRQGEGPPPAPSASRYDQLFGGWEGLEPGPQVVTAGLSAGELADLQAMYPALESFLQGAQPVAKELLAEADAALFDWLSFIDETYPAARFERDRRRWRQAFRRHFEATETQAGPLVAFETATERTREDFADELARLRAVFEHPSYRVPGIEQLLQREDVFGHLIGLGLFERELVAAAWELYGQSTGLMAGNEHPETLWPQWHDAIRKHQSSLEERLREGVPPGTNPIRERVRALRKKDPKAPSPALLQNFDEQVTTGETPAWRRLQRMRSRLHASGLPAAGVTAAFVQLDFSHVLTVQQVIRALRGYSALVGRDGYRELRRSAYPVVPSNNVLLAIEESPYALFAGLQGAALAAVVMEALAQDASTGGHRQLAEAYRRVIAAMTADPTSIRDAKTAAAVARAFAAARPARAEIDFLGLDYFFQQHFARVKNALPYELRDVFTREYKRVLLGGCNRMWKPLRRLWLNWET